MRLKTFRATNMTDALAAVKKDLGKDAVILHTRAYTQGGWGRVGAWLGMKTRSIVEITASDDPRALSPRDVRQARQTRASEPAPAAATVSGAVARAYGQPGPTGDRPMARPAGAGTPAARGAPVNPVTVDVADVMPVAESRAARDVAKRALNEACSEPRSPGDMLDPCLRDELTAIKRMVGQVLQSGVRSAGLALHEAAGGGGGGGGGVATVARPATAMPDALLKHYCRLIENEVARELADEIVSQVRDELSPAELADEGVVRQTILRRLESLLPIAENVAVPHRRVDGRPLTIALVGPTGVGKTTTIAKLAAAYKLRHGKKVGLITSDTYRIAAVDQLRTYANIIGVPLKVVLTPEEMRAAVESLAGMDVVLIDTAGRSPGDAERVGELASFVAAADPHQTHLVLSSVVSEACMVRTADRFASLKPSMVIFTKLDEAANFGVLVNVAQRLSAKLSYVTTGQEVPDDIEPGRADRLARLVLDGNR